MPWRDATPEERAKIKAEYLTVDGCYMLDDEGHYVFFRPEQREEVLSRLDEMAKAWEAGRGQAIPMDLRRRKEEE